MKSSFFYGDACAQVARKIKRAINAAPDFLTALTAASPRAAGDAIQALVEARFETAAGDWCAEYSSAFARRAMADLAFKDREGFYCIVDVKTHRADTQFNMPALVSVERLARFYEDDMNLFAILLIRYAVDGVRVRATEVVFCPVEFLDWNCLTIGALGWGQIQLADSNRVIRNRGQSRKSWMLSLCAAMVEFYPKQIARIEGRISRFNEVESYWRRKKDIWV